MAQSNRKTIKHILNTYKTAWETHDPALLIDIFSKDAIYQEKPGNILNGIKEIQAYWTEIAQTQRNVQFVVKEIMQCNRVIIIEWSSKFERTDIEELWELDGVMLLHLEAGQINRLKEYFFINRKTLPQLQTHSN